MANNDIKDECIRPLIRKVEVMLKEGNEKFIAGTDHVTIADLALAAFFLCGIFRNKKVEKEYCGEAPLFHKYLFENLS